MKLTRYTDYSLRVLMHLAARPDRLASIGEVARAYGISENHLMKVVQALGREGFIATIRGRGGGIRLARGAEAISVGDVVRTTEEDCTLAECDGCSLMGNCRLAGVLAEARRAFFAALDRYTIADITKRPQLVLPAG